MDLGNFVQWERNTDACMHERDDLEAEPDGLKAGCRMVHGSDRVLVSGHTAHSM
jgi:hypothetical protein